MLRQISAMIPSWAEKRAGQESVETGSADKRVG
jgi:hypothetical protein